MAVPSWYSNYLKTLHPDPAVAIKIEKLQNKLLKIGMFDKEKIRKEIAELKKLPNFTTMPIKKKPAAAKKPAVLGPKAKLMKLAVTTLRTKAKKLGISDVSKRTKENLVQSIILGEARQKKGTAAGKKATAKRKASTTRQTGSSSTARDRARKAKAPGRRVSATGRVYYERRKNRSDKPGQLAGEKYQGWTNYETWLWNLNTDNDSYEYLNGFYQDNPRLEDYEYAQALKEYWEEYFYEYEDQLPAPIFDLAKSAFQEINWLELSRAAMEGIY
jgi:hypothetical protein